VGSVVRIAPTSRTASAQPTRAGPRSFAQELVRAADSLPEGCTTLSSYVVSIVIPVHNEEAILDDLIRMLIERCDALALQSEFLICENGSQDGTAEIAQRLSDEHKNVRLISLETASYGAALRTGILEAAADCVVVFNADLWSGSFLVEAVSRLRSGCDLVIGSKCLISTSDKRSPTRRLITRSFNLFLRIAFGFTGTDTHGMKAMRRSRIIPVVTECRTSREVFDTELVLRAQRAGLTIHEVPVAVEDMRPARLSLLRRVPSTAQDLFIIARTLGDARPLFVRETVSAEAKGAFQGGELASIDTTVSRKMA